MLNYVSARAYEEEKNLDNVTYASVFSLLFADKHNSIMLMESFYLTV